MTVHGGPGVQIDGRDKVQAYRSSAWAQRGFCVECGTHLYYYLIPAKDYILSAGLFEESRGYAFNKQIFVDKKPGNYAFANDTEQLTEAQVFAKHK